MHKYDLLEKIYYKKLYTKYIIYFSIFLIIITLSIILIKLFSNNTSSKTELKHSNNKLFLKPMEPKITFNPINNENEEIIQKPQPQYQQPRHITTPPKPQPIISKPVKTNPVPQSQIVIQQKQSIQQPIPTSTIKIEKKDVNQILLIQHFNKNPNYIDAINLAKYFYKRNNYEQTIKWALKANELNPEKYNSWLYYAKALKAQYKLKEAREVLKSYLDNYGPNEKIENELKGIK